MRRFFHIFPVLISIVPFLLYGMAGKAANLPLKAVTYLMIQNGEFLKYGRYRNGEKYANWFFVTILTNIKENGNSAIIYNELLDIDDSRKLPSDYRNYSGYAIVNLDEGVLRDVRYNLPEVTNGAKNGEYARYYHLDKEKDILEMESKFLDGNESKTRTFKLKPVQNYPIWDLYYGMMFGCRFLDIINPGIAYVSIPEASKELLPMFYKEIKKENIKVKAGEFEVIKYATLIADPFLGQLMEAFTRESYVYIENSDRRLCVLMHSAVGEDIILEEITNIFSIQGGK